MTRAKWALAVALAAFVLAGATAPHAALPVAKRSFAQHTRIYEVTFEYPQTGSATIDREIADWARTFMHDFETESNKDHRPQERPYTADLRYEVPRNDGKVFAVVFHYAYDLGGAHPNSAVIAFNYLMPDGWRVYLPEIIKPDGFGRISELAIADLDRRLEIAPPNDESVRNGAGPYSFNFTEFKLLKNEIVVWFDPYAVAGHADGEQQAHIPLGNLKDVMRTDWRAPQPSFDCGDARSVIEHAICADVALARLDRDVSEEFLHRTMVDADKTYIERTRAEQRDWLTKRDRDCTPAPALKACLTAAYNARLKVLAPGL
jgi:uncharacterized protein YecT (DUF1311 family)